ncbi:MAG TPA: hypothetical protein VFJ95_07890 [Gammaproteobacteria bacterium]|nr:hypothetical protein [Gammaproteobacteria bacterium]
MPRILLALQASAALALAGCAAVTTVDGQRLGLASADFRTYVERVFREQNRVASDLGFALEDRSDPALTAAEDELLAACAGVNELATLRRDEQRTGLRRGAAAARTVPACEQATRAARAALRARVEEVDPSRAGSRD